MITLQIKTARWRLPPPALADIYFAGRLPPSDMNDLTGRFNAQADEAQRHGFKFFVNCSRDRRGPGGRDEYRFYVWAVRSGERRFTSTEWMWSPSLRRLFYVRDDD